VALVVSGAVLRLAVTVWSPTLTAAIARLPSEGVIDNGHLFWPGNQALSLADNAFVSVSVTPSGVPAVAQSADLQFELRSTSLTITSLLGSIDVAYPRGYVFALNRTELEPRWGAWRPHVLAGVALATFVGLLLLWALLGTVLAVPLRAYALLVDRCATFAGCGKLAVAALLPGALIMGTAILAYGFGHLRVGELLILNGVHLLVGSAYLLISPLFLPPGQPTSPFCDPPLPATSENPFAVPPSQVDPPAQAPEQLSANPFARDCSPPPASARAASPRSEQANDDAPLNPS
jgi:hypothetical protein